MPRNKHFSSLHREPLRSNVSLDLLYNKISGPISCLNPTRAHFVHKDLSPDSSRTNNLDDPTSHEVPNKDEQLASKVQFQWRSRDNRKGRHSLLVKRADKSTKVRYIVPKSTRSLQAIRHGLWQMVVYYPYWDVSWWVAVIFTLGSVVWVINAFFAWLPAVDPGSAFPNESLDGGGITAFIGATIFEVGSVLLMLEAVNENRSGCFGWALEKAFEGLDGRIVRIRKDLDSCTHHHVNRHNFVGKGRHIHSHRDNTASDHLATTTSSSDSKNSWQWFPSWHELKTHYLHEIGFLACSAQMFGATIFWISGFTALPGVNNVLSQGLLDGVFWVPQIVGGTGFIMSGLLFMLETQKRWYIPAWSVLGWHVGLWNLIGAFGFTVSIFQMNMNL